MVVAPPRSSAAGETLTRPVRACHRKSGAVPSPRTESRHDTSTVPPVLSALQGALSEAALLGHQWVGPEHVVLALLNDRHPSPARRALIERDFDHDSYRDRFLASLLDGDPPIRSSIVAGVSATPAPIFSEIVGWIEGYAAATGVPASDDTVLLALTALRPDAIGLVAPTTPMRRVDVPPVRLVAVQRSLREAGLLIGLNTDVENGRAWVIVDDSTDEAAGRVTEIVDEILARSVDHAEPIPTGGVGTR